MRLRISRKLIRHLRAQCFARYSLKFEKRSQFFVGGDDESLSVVAVCVTIRVVRPQESTAETQPNFNLPVTLLDSRQQTE
jgi:hypothetical protein